MRTNPSPTETWCRRNADTLILEIRIQPRSNHERVVGVVAGRLKVCVTTAPIDGAANQRLLGLLAREFKVPKSRIRLLSGTRSRDKRIAIESPRRYPNWLEAQSDQKATS